jgi:tRNA nucleotidyltransferase/poly(A) polymerase
VCKTLALNNFKAYIVGGSIRDIILKFQPKDWDVATDALPKDIIKVFKGISKVIPTGIKHGTVTIIYKNSRIEVTTFRKEDMYIDGRRPSEVTFIKDINEDLARRDLSINAIAYDPIKKQLIDPYNGLVDLEKKILRMVGNPDTRLQEDGLRVIRIFRFMAELGFYIDDGTLEAIPNHFDTFNKVAKERVVAEFQKLISGDYWFDSLVLIRNIKLLHNIIPEFILLDSDQNLLNGEMNRIDLTFQLLSKLGSKSSIRLRFSVLFHQISAYKSKTSDYLPRFKKRQIMNMLKNLKFSNKLIQEISHILSVYNIPLPYNKLSLTDDVKDYYTRRYQYKVSTEFFEDLLIFQKTKMIVLDSTTLDKSVEADFRERSQVQQPISLNDLVVNGNDIIRFFKINKRSASQREFVGLCLDIIRERVEVNPKMNTVRDIENIFRNIKGIIFQCQAKINKRIRIVSNDHIRKLYRNGNPSYKSWENEHTYKLAIWLILCLLRKNRDTIVFFDATNMNFYAHPRHRETLGFKFRKFNPLYIHTDATEEDIKLNLETRAQEESTVLKSDADLKVYYYYKEKIKSYPDFLSTPKNHELIIISSRKSGFDKKIDDISKKIMSSNHRMIIMSGNVLSGKTYVAHAIKKALEEIK